MMQENTIEDKIKCIDQVVPELYQRLQSCDICPRNCQVNRLQGQIGVCGMTSDLKVYTAFLHQGEEPGISAGAGSGTIFFSGCNLRCSYCQNYQFSQQSQGTVITESQLAKIMLKLQEQGAVNINLVTPTHFMPQVLKSLKIAFKRGLSVPMVYNSSGYENAQIIANLGEIVDVYLSDIRYWTQQTAQQYSQAADYPKVNQKALQQMYAQKPKPVWQQDILTSALVVRHLVLPGHIEESKQVIDWLQDNVPNALVSIMFQYQPYFKAKDDEVIGRQLSEQEYGEIKEYAEQKSIHGWMQDFPPQENLAGKYFENNIESYLL